MMGYVHYVVGKNTFLVQFKDGQKKEMSYSSLVFLSLNEQVNMDDPLANLTKKEQGNFLTIGVNNKVEEPCIIVDY